MGSWNVHGRVYRQPGGGIPSCRRGLACRSPLAGAYRIDEAMGGHRHKAAGGPRDPCQRCGQEGEGVAQDRAWDEWGRERSGLGDELDLLTGDHQEALRVQVRGVGSQSGGQSDAVLQALRHERDLIRREIPGSEADTVLGVLRPRTPPPELEPVLLEDGSLLRRHLVTVAEQEGQRVLAPELLGHALFVLNLPVGVEARITEVNAQPLDFAGRAQHDAPADLVGTGIANAEDLAVVYPGPRRQLAEGDAELQEVVPIGIRHGPMVKALTSCAQCEGRSFESAFSALPAGRASRFPSVKSRDFWQQTGNTLSKPRLRRTCQRPNP